LVVPVTVVPKSGKKEQRLNEGGKGVLRSVLLEEDSYGHGGAGRPCGEKLAH